MKTFLFHLSNGVKMRVIALLETFHAENDELCNTVLLHVDKSKLIGLNNYYKSTSLIKLRVVLTTEACFITMLLV